MSKTSGVKPGAKRKLQLTVNNWKNKIYNKLNIYGRYIRWFTRDIWCEINDTFVRKY